MSARGHHAVIKKTYATPTLTNIGSVRELTMGNKVGDGLDATFPAHTPKSSLRFS